MGYHVLLQGIFPTQGLNSHLLCWQVASLPLSHNRVMVKKADLWVPFPRDSCSVILSSAGNLHFRGSQGRR